MKLRAALATLVLAAFSAGAQAQTAQFAPLLPPREPSPLQAPTSGLLSLSASYGADEQRIFSGLSWRVFRDGPEPDGTYTIAAQSSDSAPVLALPNGDYIVHVAYGLAGAVRRVRVSGGAQAERIALNAGGLRVVGLVGDTRAPAERLSVAIYVPDGADPQGKLVARDVRPEQIVRLPEGRYHIISTYLDTLTAGLAPSPTNSVVYADVRIQTGRLTEASLRHRAAQITLKLVNMERGDALANTSFTILTPGGDVIREMIGAFPSLILAEGEYVAIARRDGRTYQGAFTVSSGDDRDVEILARNPPGQ